MEVSVTATVEVRLSVSAEKWAGLHGQVPLQSPASLASALREALDRFEDLVPGLTEADGTAHLEATKWIASAAERL